VSGLKLIVLTTTLLVCACASDPEISMQGVNETATPRQAIAEIESLRGDQVLWGGIIVTSTNLEQDTRLEVLAYPLDSSQKPETSSEPTGRFLAIEPGYLETVDYRQGRLVTVKGLLSETREGEIGEADYTFPVVEIDQIYLWPEQQEAERAGGSGVNFGVGIGIIF
jgi:outer membrane lipoprotein